MTDADGPLDFIRSKVQQDLAAGAYDAVVTRFPPEPNGYLHIGHAKAICLDFGVAAEFGGHCNLRFDDTNPAAEEVEFVDSITGDIRWLGFDWGDRLFHASDYYGRLYELACDLIRKGLAYVDALSEAEIREYRGTVTTPGRPSPWRDRPVEESLDLFERMKNGEFAEGSLVLRAKIDMAHVNMKMRDPLMYRIKNAHHWRTGDAWHVYPFYDFAHGLSDHIEGVTHSFCTLEFDVNRILYDWYIDQLLPVPRPNQYEMARLEMTYLITSKRKLKTLVDDDLVSGWDDPRMPTLAGLRRLGCPPEAIRALMKRVGVSKTNSTIDYSWLEDAMRDVLNSSAPRALGVLRPLKLVITNWTGGETSVDVPTWPQDPDRDDVRSVPFGREIWIDRDDFSESPPAGWRRLAPGREVRLRSAFLVVCDEVVRDGGDVVELRCTYDPDSRGGNAPDGRKVRGTLHWVSAGRALDAEVRLYDRLFADPVPGQGKASVVESLNPGSLEVVAAKVEPSLASAAVGERFQLERLGYFAVDPDRGEGRLVLNRTVTLRDSWASRTPVSTPVESRPAAVAGAKAALSAGASALVAVHGIPEDHARVLEGPLGMLFVEAVARGASARTVSRLIVDELRRAGEGDLSAADLAEVAGRLDAGDIAGGSIRELLAALLGGEGSVAEIVAARGLETTGADAVAALVADVFADFPDEVARFRAGEKKLMGFLVGQAMRRAAGKADGKAVRQAIAAAL